MANFATLADVEDFLQIEITDAAQIDSINRALEEVTAIIKLYCNQDIEYVADDEVTIDSNGSHRLLLPQYPVISVSEVIEDGTTLDVDDDYVLGEKGILYRQPNYTRWALGPQIVTVTYTHGYQTIPDDLVNLAARAASRAFQAGLKSASDGGVMGIASKSLGDYSVSYASEQGGGVGEGIMGASAARFLLRSEKEMLDRKYSIRPWPKLI